MKRTIRCSLLVLSLVASPQVHAAPPRTPEEWAPVRARFAVTVPKAPEHPVVRRRYPDQSYHRAMVHALIAAGVNQANAADAARAAERQSIGRAPFVGGVIVGGGGDFVDPRSGRCGRLGWYDLDRDSRGDKVHSK